MKSKLFQSSPTWLQRALSTLVRGSLTGLAIVALTLLTSNEPGGGQNIALASGIVCLAMSYLLFLLETAFPTTKSSSSQPVLKSLLESLSENQSFIAVAFLLPLLLLGHPSLSRFFVVAFVFPVVICLLVFLFERLVKRPPFAPWHRLALALLCLPVFNGILNTF